MVLDEVVPDIRCIFLIAQMKALHKSSIFRYLTYPTDTDKSIIQLGENVENPCPNSEIHLNREVTVSKSRPK